MSFKRVKIEVSGSVTVGGQPLDDNTSFEVLNNLSFDDAGALWTQVGSNKALVIAEDEPLVIKSIQKNSKPDKSNFQLEGKYGFTAEVSYNSFFLDSWDRICGLTEQGLPFVLGRQAAVEFFDLLDSFDDESITIDEKAYPTLPWRPDTKNQAPNWNECYKSKDTPWDQNGPHKYLCDEFHGMRLIKSKILVLGSGYGHDAAYLAEQGHIVTAIEASPLAHAQAQARYGHIPNLEFICEDVFSTKFKPESFDVIFEHTFFCIFQNNHKTRLSQIWKNVLRPQGLLIGVFFLAHHRNGPPYCTTEWEVKRRTTPELRHLFTVPFEKSDNPVRKTLEHILCFQKL